MPAQLSSPIRRLGVLTGGGDVPGINAAIKALVYRARDDDMSVLGIRGGWEGLTFLDRSLGLDRLTFRFDEPETWQQGYIMPLTRLSTRTIDRQGGTILQSTHTNPAHVEVGILPRHLASYGEGREPEECVNLTAEVLQNMRFLELDGLVVIGGDATQSVGAMLAALGVPVWGIPETMDNDVPGTEYSLGFQTAIDRAAEFIGRIRSTAGSHRETILFRMFGRNAGFTALETAIVASVDRVLIPEVPANVDRLAELVAADRHNPHNYSTVVLSEGANLGIAVPEEADSHGHSRKANVAEFLAKELCERLPGVGFLPIDLTYILRAGEPVARDRHMAVFYANLIMSHVEAKRSGVMAAYRDGQFIVTDIPGKNHAPRRVNRAGYHSTQYRLCYEYISGPYLPQPGT
jgi:6-phosphofructokinase 1